MKNFKLSVCALALLAITGTPVMAESVDLTVKGTLIPAACVPSITGEINYGNVTAAQLDDTEYTVLPQKTVGFAINCGGPVKVAIQAINGRPGSVAGGEETGDNNLAISPVALLGYSEIVVAGLGTNNGDKIGGYAIGLLADTLQADGNKMFLKLRSMGDGWSDFSVGPIAPIYYYYSVFDDVLTYSWANSATTQDPTAITNLSAQLVVQAYLNNTTALDTSGAVQLDGLATIELVYL